jgi:CheY-like chemotaxis protein
MLLKTEPDCHNRNCILHLAVLSFLIASHLPSATHRESCESDKLSKSTTELPSIVLEVSYMRVPAGPIGETGKATIRILVVDDFEYWRRFVTSIVEEEPGLYVVCKVSDGLEAVQKAEELTPDLIVLDIGLPKMNGIEAARQIRPLSPSSRIVFLSQNNDHDVVRVALGTGALGYVHKTDARSELLPAVYAVLRGEQFVSSRSNGFWET